MKKKLLTLAKIRAIVAECSFHDWQFRVEETNGVPWLQVQFLDMDRSTGKMEWQHCRKWMLSYHMVPSEIPRSVFKAIHTAMQHEIEEAFTYKGARIYNPHLDLDKMVAFARLKQNISVRE